MLLKLGQAPVLVISSAKMAEQVMKTHDLVFSNRPQTTAAKTLLYGCQDMGFAPYGEYWRQARKICALELFSVKRVESFQYVRDEEIDSLVNKIRKSGSDHSLDLGHLFFQTSNNIVSKCVMGEKFEDEDGKSRFEEISRKAMVIVTAFCVEDFFPSFGWIIDVIRGFNWDLKNCFKTLDEFFSKVVEEHKEKIKRSGGVINIDDYESKKDFVDIMLQLQQDDKLDYHFSLDNLKAIVLVSSLSLISSFIYYNTSNFRIQLLDIYVHIYHCLDSEILLYICFVTLTHGKKRIENFIERNQNLILINSCFFLKTHKN